MRSVEPSAPPIPDLQAMRNDAIRAGGIDPMSLRFRIKQFRKCDGDFVSVPVEDVGFPDAVETTMALIRANGDSHFFLEPIGFVQ